MAARPGGLEIAPGVLHFTSRVREAASMSSLLVLPPHGTLGPAGALAVDPGILPDEIERILLAASPGLRSIGHVVLTHSHWDHVAGVSLIETRSPGVELIAAAAFPSEIAAPDARAGQSNAEKIRSVDREAQVLREPPYRAPRPRRLIAEECAIGNACRAVLAIPAPGHSADSLAVLFPGDGVLAAGDWLSPIEIPYLEGPLDLAHRTLERFAAILANGEAELVVPGHGGPLRAARAIEILEQDIAYLRALEEGAALGDGALMARIPLPRAATDPEVLRGHAGNVRLALAQAAGG